MNYFPEQTLDNINALLKDAKKTFAEMALDLKNDPMDLQQEIFSGKISVEKLGSISAYLNMPFEALFSDSIDFEMKKRADEINDDKHAKAAQRVVVAALILSHRSAQFTDDVSEVIMDEVCANAVKWTDHLTKVLNKK